MLKTIVMIYACTQYRTFYTCKKICLTQWLHVSFLNKRAATLGKFSVKSGTTSPGKIKYLSFIQGWSNKTYLHAKFHLLLMSLQSILQGYPECHFWEDLTSLQRKKQFLWMCGSRLCWFHDINSTTNRSNFPRISLTFAIQQAFLALADC